jgi:hypothetical protein
MYSKEFLVGLNTWYSCRIVQMLSFAWCQFQIKYPQYSCVFIKTMTNLWAHNQQIKEYNFYYITELSKSLSCLSNNRSGRCGQCVRPTMYQTFAGPYANLVSLFISYTSLLYCMYISTCHTKCVVLTLNIPMYHLKL